MINIPLKIAVISNVIFDPYFAPLIKKKFTPIKIELLPIPYYERNEDEYEIVIKKADYTIIWLNIENMALDIWNNDEIIRISEKLYNDISKLSQTKIIWFSHEDYFAKSYLARGHVFYGAIDSLNIKMNELFLDKDNITFIDLKYLIAGVGVANAYDNKGKYRWNAPYSKTLIQATVDEIHKQYLIDKGMTKKCLVLDCDGVLWGGVISEDGIENIKLGGSGFGRPYQEFQRFLIDLYSHGVVLAICSKNDLSDVMTVFNEHSEMVLKEEHIACFQVNWENKPDNLKRIAEILNIGLDSMVFIDDSTVEVEAIKSMLPEVTAVLYDRDKVYDGLSCFNLKKKVNLSDITKRNDTYRTNQSREALKSKYDNYDEYIAALDIKIDIHEALPIEYSRIAELTQRTNKCTNGKRYTVTKIKERCNSNIMLYSVNVSDRFSDFGLVGAIEIDNETLELFCLSCRALGRKIEDYMILFIKNNHVIKNMDFYISKNNYYIKELLCGCLI
ncbi:MAG: HAD-IIIC family phosphatase [Oscillospiraceae bacterium]|jgi:FkbH-like protein|nr:HAD-IIIC family phosphatase [Oscillospiraceae bacterium]